MLYQGNQNFLRTCHQVHTRKTHIFRMLGKGLNVENCQMVSRCPEDDKLINVSSDIISESADYNCHADSDSQTVHASLLKEFDFTPEKISKIAAN